jgi:large subunit ribosomal protein L5e
MGFIKVVKNKAYYMRYQVKFRRRRTGQTDYQQRRGLVIQDKNKYCARKYRVVGRISNKFVTCQIIYSTIKGDVVVESAHSSELPRYGLKAGLNNYAACYATGLLLARRVLTKLGRADAYKGTEEADGTYFCSEEQEEGPRPFRAYLDPGIRRCSTGARVFGILKGAVDGGIAVPHSEKRFPGYDNETNELDAETHSKYIHAGHVAEYMEYLLEEDKSAYDAQFSKYIKLKIEGDSLEDICKATHAAIRADPSHPKKSETKHNTVVKGRHVKRSRQQRQGRVKQKLASFHHKLDAADADAE